MRGARTWTSVRQGSGARCSLKSRYTELLHFMMPNVATLCHVMTYYNIPLEISHSSSHSAKQIKVSDRAKVLRAYREMGSQGK